MGGWRIGLFGYRGGEEWKSLDHGGVGGDVARAAERGAGGEREGVARGGLLRTRGRLLVRRARVVARRGGGNPGGGGAEHRGDEGRETRRVVHARQGVIVVGIREQTGHQEHANELLLAALAR